MLPDHRQLQILPSRSDPLPAHERLYRPAVCVLFPLFFPVEAHHTERQLGIFLVLADGSFLIGFPIPDEILEFPKIWIAGIEVNKSLDCGE